MRHVELAGYLMIAGGTVFLLMWKIAEFIRPGYSVSEEVISRLGVGENALVFNTGVFLLGLFGAVAGYLLLRLDRSIAGLLIASSIGAMGVGLFPMDIPIPHLVSALMAFLFSGLASLYSYRFDKGFLGMTWFLLGLISLGSLGLFLADIDLGLGRGGIERMIVYPVLIWIYSFGAWLAVQGKYSGR